MGAKDSPRAYALLIVLKIEKQFENILRVKISVIIGVVLELVETSGGSFVLGLS